MGEPCGCCWRPSFEFQLGWASIVALMTCEAPASSVTAFSNVALWLADAEPAGVALWLADAEPAGVALWLADAEPAGSLCCSCGLRPWPLVPRRHRPERGQGASPRNG